ncbi:hypothetical protein [Solilutibacter silvestris]|uniref:hypothetical protein n=1 Tax=Solilutibacter silvestris TaxID=1645665 RepID=UPI003D32B7CD
MKLRFRRRWTAALRLIALAVLALSMALRPVASSLGELHEIAHAPAGQHVEIGDVPMTVASADIVQPGQEGDGAAPLHALLHFAHCCGQAAATPAEFHLHAFNPPPVTRPAWHLQTILASSRWPTPFRPPIAA